MTRQVRSLGPASRLFVAGSERRIGPRIRTGGLSDEGAGLPPRNGRHQHLESTLCRPPYRRAGPSLLLRRIPKVLNVDVRTREDL